MQFNKIPFYDVEFICLSTNFIIYRPRPLSPNFHPIRPRPTPRAQLNLVPQIRPKVPATETETGEERIIVVTDDGNTDLGSIQTDKTILSNDNNGVWFIEEKLKDET